MRYKRTKIYITTGKGTKTDIILNNDSVEDFKKTVVRMGGVVDKTEDAGYGEVKE